MTEPDGALRDTADQEVEQLPTGTVLGEPDPEGGAGDDEVNVVDEPASESGERG